MDFSIRHTFAGINFKPNKKGNVKWATVKKMLEGGKVECTWYNPDGSGTSTAPAQTVIDQAERVGPDRCYIAENDTNYGNPRYALQRFVRVSFNSNSFVTLYDVGDLAELADGTEVDEACQACVGGDCEAIPEEPRALVTMKHLSLIISNP